MRNLAIAFVLILSASAAAAQPASAVIHPDSTPFTASGNDWRTTYTITTKACSTTTLKGTTGVSTSAFTFSLNVSTSPVGAYCTTLTFGNCTWTTGTVTFTVTSSTASGGAGTLKFNTALTETCASGACIFTIAPQTASGTVAYTNATTSLASNISVLVTRSGVAGAACGPASVVSSILFTVTVTPNTIGVV